MKTKFRLVGLAVSAVLVMSAVLACSASAASFTASSYPANVTAEASSPYAYIIQGQAVECTRTHFQGSLVAASEQLSLTPTYEGCNAFGIANSKVEVNGCAFLMTVGDGTTGSTHITCPAGKEITVLSPGTNPLCILHIPPQTPTTNVFKYNDTNVNKVHMTFQVAGVHTNVTDVGGFFCPLSNASTDTSGATVGSFPFSGTESKTFDIS